MAFPNAQNPTFVDCSFTEHNGNIYQNIVTGTSSAALQILSKAIAPGAAYNSEERHPPPKCLPHTRVNTIQNIQKWADGGTPVLWLHGPAGAGKSAVAQTMCETWAQAGSLLASFFISRTAPTRNTIDRFIVTIAYQAILALTGSLDSILSVIENDPHILRQDVGVQLEKLLIGPLKMITDSMNLGQEMPLFIVIDAVDERTGNGNQLRLLSLVRSLLDPKHALPIRFLIVSRPESHIVHAFNNILKPVSSTESLYSAREDVYKYPEVEFARIHNSEKHTEMMMYIPKPWPGREVLSELTARSGGYFIYAATIIRHVDEEGYFCIDRLKEVLDRHSRALGSRPYRELDKVYSQVLSKARNVNIIRRILGCVIVGRHALVSPSDSLEWKVPTSSLMGELLSLRPGEFKMALRGLYSIISLSEGATHDVSFYHASFADYLLDQERSGEYYIDLEDAMRDTYLSSLRLLQIHKSTTPFVPSDDWLVAIMCWTRLGRSSELLLKHLQKDASFFPSFQSIIACSKHWPSDETRLRLISLLCSMIMVLKVFASAKSVVKALSATCQSAFAHYLSLGNEVDPWKCIQDIRTFLETDPPMLGRFPSRVALESPNLVSALQLSSAEASCTSRFLYFLFYTRDRCFQRDKFSVVTDLETGTWQDSQHIYENLFLDFLDNEKFWGRSCQRSVRRSSVQLLLALSTEGNYLLQELNNRLSNTVFSMEKPLRHDPSILPLVQSVHRTLWYPDCPISLQRKMPVKGLIYSSVFECKWGQCQKHISRQNYRDGEGYVTEVYNHVSAHAQLRVHRCDPASCQRQDCTMLPDGGVRFETSDLLFHLPWYLLCVQCGCLRRHYSPSNPSRHCPNNSKECKHTDPAIKAGLDAARKRFGEDLDDVFISDFMAVVLTGKEKD